MVDKKVEPIMTAGERADFGFGSNNPDRRNNEVKKPKPEIEVNLTPGQKADNIDSTRLKQIEESNS